MKHLRPAPVAGSILTRRGARRSSPRRETPYLALVAAGTILVAAATWTALQAVDGVTLKESVDAWAAASGPRARPTEPAPRLPAFAYPES